MMMIGIIITDKGSPTVSTCTGRGLCRRDSDFNLFQSHSVCILQKIWFALGRRRRRTGYCGGFSSPHSVLQGNDVEKDTAASGWKKGKWGKGRCELLQQSL